ncbi:LysR family transcriptional regulator [Paenarthrobacter nitroguajacolicus]|uniref:LysR substrate-binding domain-containing protein n=1 Tax=Paenarthrobacter nitroguajacolicus TaxID=211146 RepID=UPI0015B9ACE2|nr:LysR substrate-binding domain-containing protein [Paenarthrobacter nitroguajacolicus]NWL12959.1 LysR family transcriptional regulator [Paenarthrobacter nitroguajacolicus]
MDVTLTQLRYFVEAAAQLSMTGAAVRLNVAQSAVSAAIAQLERHVGTQFFIRQRSKGLVLTPAGELFVRDAQAILAQVEESIDHARGEHQSVSGRIRVACFSTLAPFLLPGVLTKLREDHPALEAEVIETDTSGCIAALLSGQADLALCYDLDLPEAIASSVVDTVRPYVALPPDHKLAGSKTVQLSALSGEPFVLLDLPHTRDLMLSIARLGGREPDVRFQSASYETVRTFVARGLGYSILHQRPQHQLTYDGGQLAAVEIRDDVPELKTVLAHLKSHRPTARVRAVAQAVRHQIVAARSARS